MSRALCYWQSMENGALFVNVRKGAMQRRFCITRVELDSHRCGWRWTVAQIIRQLRRELRVGILHDMPPAF